jgi:hypothetical protein
MNNLTITIPWDEFIESAIKSLEQSLGPNLTLDPKSLYAYRYGTHGDIENAFSISGPPTSITLTIAHVTPNIYKNHINLIKMCNEAYKLLETREDYSATAWKEKWESVLDSNPHTLKE